MENLAQDFEQIADRLHVRIYLLSIEIENIAA